MVAIPQVITPSKASGAQIIDGSLKFEDTPKHHLLRTHTAGNTKTFTWAGWVKRDKYGGYQTIFGHVSGGSGQHYIDFGGDKIRFTRYVSSNEAALETTAVFRDTGWYHIVAIWDTTNATANDRQRLYVNGEQITDFSTRVNPSQNYAGAINTAIQHGICRIPTLDQNYNACRMSQAYFIDGRALGPEYFGFTDPLTNTWKPKKFNIRAENNVNDGTTWSNGIDAARSGDEATKGFDGSSSTNAAVNDTDMAWTVSLTGVSSMQIQCRSSNTTGTETLTVSGTGIDDLVIPATEIAELKTITVTSPNVSNLTITTSNSGSIAPGIARVFVNGYILLDGAVDNSFYLPMDGNSPIGQDKSGNGNDWTPVNFGGSVALDNPQVSGARPILNTTQGGTQAGVGVFGSKQNVGYAVTVYDDGGGNKYYIDGVKQDTVTGLIRGATYTFDTSDSTVSSHPFRFSATSNGSHGGGSEYTNGVAAITGAATTITVPHDAPNTLYYYCTSHSGMGADVTGITTNEKLADQYASNIVFASPLVGANSDVSTSIACTSTTKSVTSNGNAAAASEASNFYAGSFEFDGSGDFLNTPHNADFNMHDSKYTWELWFYTTDLSSGEGSGGYGSLISKCTASSSVTYGIGFDSSGNLFFKYWNGSGTVTTQAATSKVVVNKWYHVAVVKDTASATSGNTKIFVNGNLEATTAVSGTFYSESSNALEIGADRRSTYDYFQGYISDVRAYKGVAKYTSNFVPASTSPDILPDTPSGVSGGSKLTKITDGAVSFEGTATSKLTVADSSDFTFGTNDFCIEFYYYNKSLDGTYNIIFDCMGSNRSGIQLAFETDGDYRIEVGDGSNNWIWQSTGFDAKANKWTHFALTREGSTFRAFEDGVLLGTQTSSTAVGDPRSSAIGGYASDDSTNYGFNGFISNFRIVNGSAVYTAAFTPPTAPLTNVTNTKLLCCQSNAQAGAAVTSPNMGGINNGTQWSSYLTVSDSFTASGRAAGFDGSTGTFSQPGANSSSITWAPSGGITYSTSVEVYTYQSNGVFTTVSDGAQSVSWTDLYQGWKTIASGGGTFTSTTLTSGNPSVSDSRPTFAAVRVDGTILVDPLSPYGDVAATNFNPFNTDINTVRGQETGYATLNPLANYGLTLANGNLDWQGGTNQRYCRPTLFADSGKWYCEFHMRSTSHIPGIIREDHKDAAGNLGELASSRFQSNGTIGYSGGNTVTGGTTWAAGDCVQLFMDMDNKAIYWGVNGIMKIGDDGNSGDPLSGSNYTGAVIYPGVDSLTDRISEKAWGPAAGTPSANDTSVYSSVNFGQKPFKFPPPEGYQPWNTANKRPVKVISRPDQYVGITTWTGDGTNNRVIQAPIDADFAWIKFRNQAYSHSLYDTVRGNNKRLVTNSTGAEGTVSFSFLNDKNIQISGASDTSQNDNNDSLVGWFWRAGGNKNTFNVDDVGYATAAAAGLDSGTTNPTGASVGTKQGFSIIRYTGNNANRTISHGLSEPPKFWIYKNLTDSTNWPVNHTIFGSMRYIYLNLTNAQGDNSGSYWGNMPTSDVLYIGADNDTNGDGDDHILYLWHDVPGLQKFGSYSGTGSSGNFVELGFRPALLMIKSTAAYGWAIVDTTRSDYNVRVRSLYPNKADAEYTGSGHEIDYLSNGFNLRNSNDRFNKSSTDYFYAAWAEAPSIDLYGGGANAR